MMFYVTPIFFGGMEVMVMVMVMFLLGDYATKETSLASLCTIDELELFNPSGRHIRHVIPTITYLIVKFYTSSSHIWKIEIGET